MSYYAEDAYDFDGYFDDVDFDDQYRHYLFADPGSGSALRAESYRNPRNLPCLTCGWPNRLTPADRALGYQCDSCATACERGTDINYYDGVMDADYVDDYIEALGLDPELDTVDF